MAQNKRTIIADLLVLLGLLMMIVMAITPLFTNHLFNIELMRWIYAAGALIVLLGRLIDIYRGSSLRLKRLHTILVFSALLYCASASMMFIYEGTSNWIAFLLAGVIIQLYASWMIEREQKKE